MTSARPLLALLLLILPACKKADPMVRDDAVVSALVTAEETCLSLAPRMNALSKGLLNLRLPGPGTEGVFAPSVTVSDIGPALTTTPGNGIVLEAQPWPVAKDSQKAKEVNLWRPLLDGVSAFEYARVFVIDGVHPDGDPFRFEANGGFEALAKMKSGEWRSLHGKMTLSWQRPKVADGKAGEWQITGWKTERMHWSASPKRFFVEALDAAMGGSQEAAKLRRSLHYEAAVQHYRNGMKELPHPYFAPISANQKEGL